MQESKPAKPIVSRISDTVWKFAGFANVYFLDLPKHSEKIIIDTSARSDRQKIISFLGKVVDFNKITKVIFTHIHLDHSGNFDLFPNASLFASKEAIEDFKSDPAGAVFSEDIANKLKFAKLNSLPLQIANLKIIKTPGHTRGGICIFKEDDGILFSGDTLFYSSIGRTDLPTSVPEKMQESLNKLVALNHKILCPGHDY